nr:AsmA-like C-terminal region-containing protein [Rhodovarius crocodyli]
MLCLPLLALATLWLALPRLELAGMAAGRISARLDRQATIGSLRVTPGLTLRVALRDVKLANITGGSRPDMLTLRQLDAGIALWPLLMGRLELTDAAAEGASLLLERDGERRGNWQGARQTRSAAASGRDGGWYAALLRVTGSEILIRTSSGKLLRVGVDEAEIATDSRTEPVRLHARGSYNDLPLALQGRLGSFAELAQAERPFPMKLEAQSRRTQAALDATASDPMNFDRWQGRLELRTPELATFLRDLGVQGAPDIALELAGDASREGDVWALRDAAGSLDGQALTAPLLRLTEGLPGVADDLDVQLDATRLDLNRLLGRNAGPAPDGDADTRLVVDRNPDPTITARLTARELLYGEWRATNAALRVNVTPGRIEIPQASGVIAGARLQAAAEAQAVEGGTAVEASVTMREGRLDALRQLLGLRPLPLEGAVTAEAHVQASGGTLRQAMRRASGTAVLSIRNGSIERAVIEAMSTDLRAIFRTAPGRTPLRCALAVVVLREGRGRVMPLRLRAATGTVQGSASFDLMRRQLDLAVRSQRDTTDFLALDLPIRVHGSFANPEIGLGSRDSLPGDGAIALPEGLRATVRQNGC